MPGKLGEDGRPDSAGKDVGEEAGESAVVAEPLRAAGLVDCDGPAVRVLGIVNVPVDDVAVVGQGHGQEFGGIGKPVGHVLREVGLGGAQRVEVDLWAVG